MKKLFLLFVMMNSIVAFAQLKVSSLGNVSIQDYSPNSNIRLSVGHRNFSDTAIVNVSSCIRAADEYSTKKLLVGVNSVVNPISALSQGRCYGVRAGAGNITNGYCYGVYGYLASLYNGAGIYGTLYDPEGECISGRWAGYFDDNVYVEGSVRATSFITPSDINLKENIVSLSSDSYGRATLANLMDMNVIKYNYKYKPRSVTMDDDMDEAERNCIQLDTERRKQASKQVHFGLSVQELQTIYPELVREGQDGSLGVNYVELVPILIRSIQELKQELDEVRAGAEFKTRSVGDETDDFSAVSKGNVLYQNNPNPFKEQTVIRFKLAENVQNASICIFDMTGKTIKKLPISSGMESVSVGGYEIGEGMFLYSLVVNGQEIDTKRMIISK